MLQPRPLPPNLKTAAYSLAPLEALDTCHQEILVQLDALKALADHVAEHGADEAAREQARALHLFFARHALQHHQDEERHVFPALLRSRDADLIHKVQVLRQDHAWLEANWLELAPRLDAMARGYAWAEPDDVRRIIRIFSGLYRDHVHLEETLIYPQARACMSAVELRTLGREMAARHAAERRGPASEIDVAEETDDDPL